MAKARLTFRNALRMEEILVVLWRHGFTDVVASLQGKRTRSDFIPAAQSESRARWMDRVGGGSGSSKPNTSKSDSATNKETENQQQKNKAKKVKPTRWERMRTALEELGPTFVKFGQIMSNRADILPYELIVELSKLQDQVPPFSMNEVDTIIKNEFGVERSDIFPVFNPTPVASASIAQVHEAYTADGKRVAVKVQRPDILPIITRDLDVLTIMARMMERYIPELKHFNPPAMVEEFSRQLNKELDFTQELHNMERFAQIFKGNSAIHVPQAYRLYSSKRVLTMEFVQGTKLALILENQVSGFDRHLLAERLAELMLDQVFIHGFFHADPHPGNVMILDGNVACFLDFGMMGRIQSDEQRILVEMLMAMADSDYKRITQSLLRLLGHATHDIPELELEIADLLDTYFDRPMGELDFGEVFQRLVHAVQGHKLNVPSKFLLMAKALVIAEGVGSRLSPDFSFMSLFGPFGRKMAARQLRPDRLVRALGQRGELYLDALQEVPLDLGELLKSARRGELMVNFRAKGLEPLRETIDTSVQRIVFGLLLAAILISSSLIIRADVPPLIGGVPVIGIVGFAIAGVMSFGFLISLVARMMRKARKGD